MQALLIILAVTVVIGLLMGKNSRLSRFLDDGTSPFENWVTKTRWRGLQLTILTVAVAYLVGFAFGHALLVVRIFANGFFLFIFYNVAHSVGRRKNFRTGLALVFLVCFIGSIVGLALFFAGLIR